MSKALTEVWPSSTDTRITIGIIYNDSEQCLNAIQHLKVKGFQDASAQLLTIDNETTNRVDCYTGIRKFLDLAKGGWVIVIHQDVEVIDDYDHLISCLVQLEAVDPHWAVAGNVGFADPETEYFRISDPYREDGNSGNLPAPVSSLDENFLVVRKNMKVTPSFDLQGFHFYGTDLCLQAYFRGCSSWVIDYHVRHLSAGKLTEHFFESLAAFEKKYSGILSSRRLKTPSTLLLFGTWQMGRPVRMKVQGGARKINRFLSSIGIRKAR